MKNSRTIIIALTCFSLLISIVAVVLTVENNRLNDQIVLRAVEIKDLSVEKDDLNTLNEVLQKEVVNLKQDVSNYETDIQSVQKNTEQLNKSLSFYQNAYELESSRLSVTQNLLAQQVAHVDGKNELAMIYSGELGGSEFIYAYIAKEETLEANIEKIAHYLSTYTFDGLSIEVLRIEDDNSKQIAYIDLVDSEDARSTWLASFFQGSELGYFTSHTIVESFLQNNRDIGEWIDGIKLTYNGKSGEIADHVGGLFNNVHLRR